MHFNEDGNSGRIDQEIYVTILPNMEYYKVVYYVKYTDIWN